MTHPPVRGRGGAGDARKEQRADIGDSIAAFRPRQQGPSPSTCSERERGPRANHAAPVAAET